jgi:hypothetical protein
MAQHDPPYGGRIRVQSDGSVRWLIRERVFPNDHDADGTLEYAIRVVDENRSVFGTADGKCLLVAHPTSQNIQGGARFLIVSGYETLPAPADAIIIGKSYFVTADRFGPEDVENPTAAQVVPSYDLILRYDHDDLAYASLPKDFDPRKVEVCFLHYASARELLGLPPLPDGGTPVSGRTIAAGNRLADAELEKRFGMRLQGIKDLRAQLEREGTDTWVAEWRSVSTIATPVRPIAGAQSVTVKGLAQPGSFALMFHSPHAGHAT